mmetsp:Transcript_6554/g.11863  ORF Transcript_6554/g.11863 Transcript_6554/m.11863 type:complete len:222 (-) Transcript_6554:3476-4141(-)
MGLVPRLTVNHPVALDPQMQRHPSPTSASKGLYNFKPLPLHPSGKCHRLPYLPRQRRVALHIYRKLCQSTHWVIQHDKLLLHTSKQILIVPQHFQATVSFDPDHVVSVTWHRSQVVKSSETNESLQPLLQTLYAPDVTKIKHAAFPPKQTAEQIGHHQGPSHGVRYRNGTKHIILLIVESVHWASIQQKLGGALPAELDELAFPSLFFAHLDSPLYSRQPC